MIHFSFRFNESCVAYCSEYCQNQTTPGTKIPQYSAIWIAIHLLPWDDWSSLINNMFVWPQAIPTIPWASSSSCGGWCKPLTGSTPSPSCTSSVSRRMSGPAASSRLLSDFYSLLLPMDSSECCLSWKDPDSLQWFCLENSAILLHYLLN